MYYIDSHVLFEILDVKKKWEGGSRFLVRFKYSDGNYIRRVRLNRNRIKIDFGNIYSPDNLLKTPINLNR